MQLLQDFECFANSKVPRDKAADLILLEADLQQQHPQLPGLVRREEGQMGKGIE